MHSIIFTFILRSCDVFIDKYNTYLYILIYEAVSLGQGPNQRRIPDLLMYILCLLIIYFFTLCSSVDELYLYTFLLIVYVELKGGFSSSFSSEYVRFSFSIIYKLAFIALIFFFPLEIAVQYIQEALPYAFYDDLQFYRVQLIFKWTQSFLLLIFQCIFCLYFFIDLSM